MSLASVKRENSARRRDLMTQDFRLKFLFNDEKSIKKKLRSER